MASIPSTDNQISESGRHSLIARYLAAVFFYWIALYLYVPTLPTYAESKSETLALAGIVLAQYGLWQAIARLPVGTAADWIGRRKPFIIVGFVLTGLGALIMGVANDVNTLVVGRAITGLAAATWVPLVVAFSDLFPAHESVRASAMLMFVGSIGRVLATGVTGWLNGLGGYPLAFFVASGVALLAILIMLPSREARREPKKPSLGSIAGIATRRDVLVPSLLAAVAQYANWGTTFGFLPILARKLGATDVTLSFLLSLNIVVLTVGNLLTTALANRVGERRLLYLSFTLLALGIGGAALAPSLPWLFVAQFCIGFSQSFAYPILMGLSIQHVSDTTRTTAMGFFQAVYAIGMFAGPGLSGVLADAIGIRPMFGITALACLAIGLLAVYWLMRD